MSVWCTAAASKYILNKALLGLRHPQLWLLTGFYEFEDACISTLHSQGPSAKLHISAETVLAMSGVPIGGSCEVGQSALLKQEMAMGGVKIWAAQWQKLDAKYIKESSVAGSPALPCQIRLLPDATYSKGTMLGGEDVESTRVNKVEFVLSQPGEVSNAVVAADIDEEYEKCFDVAEKRLLRGLS